MAKKNNPQDEQAEKMLHNALGRYQEMLFKAANTPQTENAYQYRARFINAMTQSSRVVAETAYSVAKGLPNLQTPVSELLRSFGARYGGEEIKLTTYVRMTSALTKSVDEYRVKLEQKILERERQGKVTTVADLRDIINEDLGSGEVTTVTYGSGAKMPVDKYAAMLARTTRAETENLSMITQALKEGIDLVECDIVSPTCDSCAVYQGRVYSISGKDSRYPSLYQTAFKSGYSIIHPNCRHSWSPYHAELYTDDEKQEALERSNRSWKPDGNGRNFQQMEKAREAYAIGQQKQRQWNAEILEYERMKAHYKGIGEEPPYKTLGAFRKEVRKPKDEQSVAMRKWKNFARDQQQYERWKDIVGAKNMPKTVDEFQEIKYTNKEKYESLKQIREQEIVFNIALNGGKHSGKLKNFQTYKISGLKKSVNSYNETIKLHYKKIENPWEYCTDWNSRSEQYKAGLIKDWNKDIKRNKEQRDIALALIRRLEDKDE